MKILFVLVSFVTFCNLTECVEVECDYKNFGGFGYTCVPQNGELITSKDDCEVTAVKGNHLNGKSDNDVTGLWVHERVVKFFPRGLTKFFKNLENVEINRSDLQKISKDDLKEFGEKLKTLTLVHNKIEVIDVDLFEHNKKIRNLNLSWNKIKNLRSGIFNGLNELKSLDLDYNPCTAYDDFAQNDHEKVLELIKSVEEKCKGDA